MSRRQAAEALVIRLMSASLAATAIITATCGRSTQTPHSGGETRDPFAGFESLVDANAVVERAEAVGPPNTTARKPRI